MSKERELIQKFLDEHEYITLEVQAIDHQQSIDGKLSWLMEQMNTVQKRQSLLWSALNQDNIASGRFEVLVEQALIELTQDKCCSKHQDNELLALCKLLLDVANWIEGVCQVITCVGDRNMPIDNLVSEETRKQQVDNGIKLGSEAYKAATTIQQRLTQKLVTELQERNR